MNKDNEKYIKAPLGMKDIFKDDRFLWEKVENAARKEFEIAGYHEIRTPVFEDTRLFVRSIGETTDIVEKEM
ncbi:MAG: histidine--tRNA ligase, partial [Candidatus Scalinduaceae bacterium]